MRTEIGTLTSDQCAFDADIRFPSNYKKLRSYTLNWRTRLVFEHQCNPCMFVTLTFDPAHYDVDDEDDDVRKAKLKKCWQLFYNRFRSNLNYRHIDLSRFKYYAISERGDDGRLHFHSLIYGFPYKSFPGRNNKGQRVKYVQFNEITDLIVKSWNKGFCTFEATCPENIEYVTKYIHKRRISGDYISLKSNGLGLSFLDDAKKQFFHDTDQQYYHIGRKKYYLPRYLKKKIWTDDEEYREMNIRLAKKIQEEEIKKIKNDVKITENRHYVIQSNSDFILESACNYSPDGIQFYKDPETLKTIDLCDLKHHIDQQLGFVYDPADDTIQVYLCREELDPLTWVRLKERTNDNCRMKSVYNKRL